MDDPEDPVQSALGGSEDLYDVATWDPRSGLDRVSVQLHAALVLARTVAIVGVALALFVGLFGLAFPIVADQPLLGALGLISIVPAFLLVGYLWYDDPTRSEPLEPLAITFLLAVLFATFAALLNEILLGGFVALPAGMAIYFFVVVGPVEETVKWLAVRLHAYGRPAFNTVVDGVVYGAVAGLGFAAIENLIYIVGPGHVIFSAWAGYYLGLAKFNPDHRGPLVVKGLLIAALLHGLYNTIATYVPLSTTAFIAFVVLFDGILLALLLRKVRRYEGFLHRANDVGTN